MKARRTDPAQDPRLVCDVAGQLRVIRHRAGLSLKHVADRIGISEQAYYAAERRDQTAYSVPRLDRMARAMGYRVVIELEPLEEETPDV